MLKTSLKFLTVLGLALAGFSPAWLPAAHAQAPAVRTTANTPNSPAAKPGRAPVMAVATPANPRPVARETREPAAPKAAPAAPTESTSPGRSKSEDDHILAPGDLIDVKVFQEPDLDSTLRVSDDGTVVFPLIDRVRVGGITPQGAAKLIRNLLDKDYLVAPHVNVRVTEYARRRFTVLGQVQKPNSYDMPDRDTVTVLEAIAMAGGYTRTADPSKVTVKRKANDKENIYKLNAKKMASDFASFEVLPGDVIMVAEGIF